MRLAPVDDFETLAGLVHLAAGGEAPSLTAQREAVTSYVGIKGRAGLGTSGFVLKQAAYDRAKASAAAIFGVTAEEVAYCSSAAEGMSQVALSLPWRAGDNVVIEDSEFLSASLPFTRLGHLGVETRVVRHADWTPEEAHIAAATDARTRAIAVSQVNYLTGVQHNLEALRAIADRSGAWLAADVTHAAGAAPVPARLCDFAVSATYKWLLGCQGVALLVWNRERVPEVEPAICGWRSVVGEVGAGGDPRTLAWRPDAVRLEAGNPPWLAIFYLDTALAYLRGLGLENIYEHDAALTADLYDRLQRLDLDLATPADRRWRAGNTCFWTEQPEAVARELEARGIMVSGYGGRVRISTHVWNDESDLDACVEALRPLVGAAARA
jgi:cysteine desulfurase / selenocysteine lyase